jgi:hypothetical protein
MKTHILKTFAFTAFAIVPMIGTAQTQGGGSSQGGSSQGGGASGNQPSQISLRIADASCGALAPNGANTSNQNPGDINDNDLDDAEVTAIQQGCTLRAIVTDRQGRRVSGQSLILTRSDATGISSFFPFGRGRTTNAQGQAIWRFQPTPNTDFLYQATTSPGSGGRARSNTVEIQLCTGEDSVGAIEGAPTVDAGKGCQG